MRVCVSSPFQCAAVERVFVIAPPAGWSTSSAPSLHDRAHPAGGSYKHDISLLASELPLTQTKMAAAKKNKKKNKKNDKENQLTSPCTAPPGGDRSVVHQARWSQLFWAGLHPGSDAAAWRQQVPLQTLRSDEMELWVDSWLCSLPTRRRSRKKEAEPDNRLAPPLQHLSTPSLPDYPPTVSGCAVGVWAHSIWWGPCGALREEEDNQSISQSSYPSTVSCNKHSCCSSQLEFIGSKWIDVNWLFN